jgi:hypothetical protein
MSPPACVGDDSTSESTSTAIVVGAKGGGYAGRPRRARREARAWWGRYVRGVALARWPQRRGDCRTALKPAVGGDRAAAHASDGRTRNRLPAATMTRSRRSTSRLCRRPAQDGGALGASLFRPAPRPAVPWASEPGRYSEVLQLCEELMEGASQPTRITGPRPRHGGTIERARDRVLDGACSYFYYRVTTVL